MPKSPQTPQSPKTPKATPEGKGGKGSSVGAHKKADVRVPERSNRPDRTKSGRGAGPLAASDSETRETAAQTKPKTWPKGGPSKSDLKRYRQALIDLRTALLSSSRNLADEALKASGQDFSVDHMADHGSDNYEQDFSLKLLEGESEQLADITEALMKIDGKFDVPFGLCEACTDEPLEKCESCPWIPATRLDVLPHAKLCVKAKEMQERGRLS